MDYNNLNIIEPEVYTKRSISEIMDSYNELQRSSISYPGNKDSKSKYSKKEKYEKKKLVIETIKLCKQEYLSNDDFNILRSNLIKIAKNPIKKEITKNNISYYGNLFLDKYDPGSRCLFKFKSKLDSIKDIGINLLRGDRNKAVDELLSIKL